MKNKSILNHYHCQFCGGIMEKIGRIAWRVKGGITIIYKCNCGVILVKYEDREYSQDRWINI